MRAAAAPLRRSLLGAVRLWGAGPRAARCARRASVRVRAGRVARRRAATAGCVRGRAGRNAVRGLVSRRGLRTIDVRLRRRVHRARFRGSRAISYRGRHAAVIMTRARLTRGTDDKGNYLGKQIGHCAGMNGAPLTRTPPRRSWGRGPPPPGWRRIQARRLTCLTASYAAPTGRVPGLRGAFIIASTPYSCVGFGDQHRGIVVLLK